MSRTKGSRLSPEIEALLASIPEVRARGSEESACLRTREGKPKLRYTSAACARRAVVAFAWQMGEDRPSMRTVIYLCQFCGWYHSGRSRVAPIPDQRPGGLHANAA